DGLCYLCGRIFDELRFIQDQRSEIKLRQSSQIAAKESVIRNDDIVLRNLLTQVVPSSAAFHHQNLQLGCEAIGFATPVMQNRGGADDQRGFGILGMPLALPCEPGERLQRFAQSHVVGQNPSEFDAREVTEKIEPVLL